MRFLWRPIREERAVCRGQASRYARRVKRAANLSSFVARPVPYYFAGECFVVWAYSDDLVGTIAWGAPTEHDLEALCRVWEHTRVMRGPFDVITDFRRVRAFHPLTFEVLARYVGSRRDEYLAKIRAHAQIIPEGAVGATVAGFNVVVEQNKTWFLAHHLAGAVARLGRTDTAAVIAALEALADQLINEPALLAQLRTALEENPALDAADAAKRVGLSLRTMQRSLGELETSFLEVRDRVRVALAERLLAESGHKAEVIARRIGLESREGLWRLLRRHGIEPKPDTEGTT